MDLTPDKPFAALPLITLMADNICPIGLKWQEMRDKRGRVKVAERGRGTD